MLRTDDNFLVDAWKLVAAHRPFLARVAQDYRSFGVPLEDLEAEGVLGLLDAAGRYDGSRGVEFLSYAVWWVRKRMRDCVARQACMVRIPRNVVEGLRRVRTAESDLQAALGRSPTRDEIGLRLSLAPGKVDALMGRVRWDVSLDDAVGKESGLRLEDVLPQDSVPPADREFIRDECLARILHLLPRLPAREREVLRLRHGLDGCPPQSLGSIGRRFGCSRERIRQVEKRAVDRLRGLIETATVSSRPRVGAMALPGLS